jgi:type IV secretory pathway protease TraF
VTRRRPRRIAVDGAATSQPVSNDRGASTVAVITLCFVFMTGALIWLSHTVDRTLNNRADAAEVALQAARAGAQAIDITVLTQAGVLALDQGQVGPRAQQAAAQVLAQLGETGAVTAVTVDGLRVTVTVQITTTGRPVSASASATAVLGKSDIGR